MKKKAVKLMSILLAAALLVGASVGGTLAWLSAKSDTVVNTFTVGNINIKLEETDATYDDDDKIFNKSFKMVPGGQIDKDPKVTVLANSEACWLFVKVEEINNTFDTSKKFITYTEAGGWTELSDDGDNNTSTRVFYREVSATGAANSEAFPVFANNQVSVNADITKDIMDGITDSNRPKLSITAYAVQSDNITGADDAAKAAAAWAYTANAVASTVPTP